MNAILKARLYLSAQKAEAKGAQARDTQDLEEKSLSHHIDIQAGVNTQKGMYVSLRNSIRSLTLQIKDG